MIDKNKLYEDLERLVAMPSISGTDQEVTAAVKIEEILKELPYFRENPDQVMRVEVKDDPYGRFLPAAYLKAPVETADTIILTGHYDVVDVEEYGRMQDDAFDIKGGDYGSVNKARHKVFDDYVVNGGLRPVIHITVK